MTSLGDRALAEGGKSLQTWTEWATSTLVDMGMWPNDVAGLLAKIRSGEDGETDTMGNRWNDRVEHYPVQMKAVMLLMLKRRALEWIDANCPQAWYRPMFDDEQLAEIMANSPPIDVKAAEEFFGKREPRVIDLDDPEKR